MIQMSMFNYITDLTHNSMSENITKTNTIRTNTNRKGCVIDRG